MWMIHCLIANNWIHRIIDDYKCQTKSEYEDKKRVLSILNAVKNYVVDFFLNGESISKFIRKYRPQILDKMK